MRKLVVLKLEEGRNNQEIAVSLEIGEEGKRETTSKSDRLDAPPNINVLYNNWQTKYKQVIKTPRLGGVGQPVQGNPQEDLELCQELAEQIKTTLNQWYKEEFKTFKDTLIEKVKPSDTIRLVIQTDLLHLQRIPWHLIDFFQSYTNAEVVVSPLNFSQIEVVNTRPKFKVQVLAIIGNNKGINLEEDKKELKKQLLQANIEFLEKPTREQIIEKLNERQWDILFFAGHSNSDGESQEGYIYINDSDRLSIAQLKNTLRNAIKRGLKLAIFNSCEGINLARVLSDLQIPQVIVMREPIPDEVAHKFLKYFLQAFHPSKLLFENNSLPIAVRRARESLKDEGIENKYPNASWLPLIFQNSSHAPLTWQDLLYKPSFIEKIITLVFGAVIAIGFIWLFLQTPKDRIQLELIRFVLSLITGGYFWLLAIVFQWKDNIKLKIFPVNSSSAFLGVLVPFFLSLCLIPGQYIVLRNLTGLNEYSTLSLLENRFPNLLAEILEIKNEPVVDHNAIYKNIQLFRDQTGTQNLIYDRYANGVSFHSAFNENNRTNKGSGYIESLGHNGNMKYRKEPNTSEQQNQENFDNDPLMYKSEQDEDAFSKLFGLTPIHLSLNDAQWTAIINSQSSSSDAATIYQFPQLSDLSFNPQKASNYWMKNIAENNPQVRGFLQFAYTYFKSDTLFSTDDISNLLALQIGCADQPLVSITPPSPYIRFLDIKNNSFSSIQLEAIKYKQLVKNTYTLTVVDQRDSLLQDIQSKTENINLSIPPQKHLFIPIEFGFDTRRFGQNFLVQSPTPANFENITNQMLYFGQVVTNPNYFSSDDEYKNFKEKLKLQSQDENIKQLFIPVQLDESFLAKTQPITSILNSIPKRFAVGSLMNIISVRIDGKDISVDSPFNDPRFSLSLYFASGSCPYLLVYDSQKGYWIELGTVLTDRKSKSLKADEIHYVGSATTKIKLEEREKEITYIDSISILYTNPETNTIQEAKLTIPELSRTDEKYFILHQGESLDIDLNKLIPNNAKDVKLKINGYYEILEQN